MRVGVIGVEKALLQNNGMHLLNLLLSVLCQQLHLVFVSEKHPLPEADPQK